MPCPEAALQGDVEATARSVCFRAIQARGETVEMVTVQELGAKEEKAQTPGERGGKAERAAALAVQEVMAAMEGAPLVWAARAGLAVAVAVSVEVVVTVVGVIRVGPEAQEDLALLLVGPAGRAAPAETLVVAVRVGRAVPVGRVAAPAPGEAEAMAATPAQVPAELVVQVALVLAVERVGVAETAATLGPAERAEAAELAVLVLRRAGLEIQELPDCMKEQLLSASPLECVCRTL